MFNAINLLKIPFIFTQRKKIKMKVKKEDKKRIKVFKTINSKYQD